MTVSETQTPETALAPFDVSRETLWRLKTFVDVLLKWQSHTNLISESTVPDVWTRHVADSLQLLAHAPNARIFVDLGSGGGFPGLVIACAAAESPRRTIHLVESIGKKAEFLREAAQAAGVPAIVHHIRIDEFTATWPGKADIVTARALAPLDKLLGLAYPLLKSGARGLFPKGRNAEAELTAAAQTWNIDAVLAPSMTDPSARIVLVDRVRPAPRRATNQAGKNG